MKQLDMIDLNRWIIETSPIAPSDFFQERLKRLEAFDLESDERSKELLIDAFCEEAIQRFPTLTIWKGATLEGDVTCGSDDYWIASRKRYLEAPLGCVVEAKRDDFEQGLVQCLVELQACQWQNAQLDTPIDILGTVTNGSLWQFYKLSTSGCVVETVSYGLNDLPAIFGALHNVFHQCEQNLAGIPITKDYPPG